MATINDKDANIQRAESLERQTAKELAFFIFSNICLRELNLAIAVNGALLSSSSLAFTCSLR